MGKKVDAALVEAVVEKIKEDEKLKNINTQLENIAQSRKMIEANENISESEKKMHLAKFDFQETQLKISKLGDEEVKAMSEALGKVDVKVNRINLSTADGNGVVEIIVPTEKFDAFDELLEASAGHYEDMNKVIEPFIK